MTRITPALFAFCVSVPALAGPELTKADILNVVKDADPAIQACGSGGEIVKAHFVIDPQGAVKTVTIEGKHSKDAMGSCVKQIVAKLRFGPSLKSVPVNFPFRLGEAAEEAPAEQVATAASGGKQLSKKQVLELLKVLQPDLSQCGTGVVHTKFTIQPSGVVRQIKIDGDHKDDTVGACVTTRLQRVRFPTAPAATPVNFPFRLE